MVISAECVSPQAPVGAPAVCNARQIEGGQLVDLQRKRRVWVSGFGSGFLNLDFWILDFGV